MDPLGDTFPGIAAAGVLVGAVWWLVTWVRRHLPSWKVEHTNANLSRDVADKTQVRAGVPDE